MVVFWGLREGRKAWRWDVVVCVGWVYAAVAGQTYEVEE